MKKLILSFIVSLCIQSLHGMELDHSLLIIQKNAITTFTWNPQSELTQWRKKFTSIHTEKEFETILQNNKKITVMGHVENNHAKYVCLNFAIEMITGSLFLGQKAGYPGTSTANFKLNDFFEPAQNYENGDLAIYENNKHFAYVLDENYFLSKFGAFSHVIKHCPSHIPQPYGDSFTIWRLLPQYKSNNKELLRQDLMQEIEETNKKKEKQKLTQIEASTMKWLEVSTKK